MKVWLGAQSLVKIHIRDEFVAYEQGKLSCGRFAIDRIGAWPSFLALGCQEYVSIGTDVLFKSIRGCVSSTEFCGVEIEENSTAGR